MLLDSHVALWWLADHASLGPEARAVIAQADDALVSSITPWELGIKKALGKLTMPDGLEETLEREGFSLLPISADHAVAAPTLPPHHRDPFDRMLVAQAQLELLTLVSADCQLSVYDVDFLNARL